MLITKEVETKWNSKTKKYYEDLGYIYTKMGDSFIVNVEDLMNSSWEIVSVECDYCHKEFDKKYHQYLWSRNNSVIQKDACKKCRYLKAQESNIENYGTSNIMEIDGVSEKQRNTIIERYGVDNAFKADKIKQKIYDNNLEKYGVKSYTQTNEYNEKRKATCLERYGADSHMKTQKYKDMFSGENSPVWKGGILRDIRWERLTSKYKQWRDSIFQNDNYICQKCLQHSRNLQAHHILNWNDNEEYRYNINNGITFCVDCHVEFHRIYGTKNNNSEQLSEFLQKR